MTQTVQNDSRKTEESEICQALRDVLSPARNAALDELLALPAMAQPIANSISYYDELAPTTGSQAVLVQLFQLMATRLEADEVQMFGEIYGAVTHEGSKLMAGLRPFGGDGPSTIGDMRDDIRLDPLNCRIGSTCEIGIPSFLDGQQHFMKPGAIKSYQRERKALKKLMPLVEKLGTSGTVPRWLVRDESGEWDASLIADYFFHSAIQELKFDVLPEPWVDDSAARSNVSDEAWALRKDALIYLYDRCGRCNRSYQNKPSFYTVKERLLERRGAVTGADLLITALLSQEYNDEWAATLL